jgi:N-acetylglucosamine kinase-like BadF-type ATPase
VRPSRDRALAIEPVPAITATPQPFGVSADRIMSTSDMTRTRRARRARSAETPNGWGVAVIAGTGSIASARSRDGRTARAGGWGYLLGDEGSGYGLTLAALQAVARAADGRGPPTNLTSVFLDRLEAASPGELIPRIYRGTWNRPALAALAPIVFDASDRGDAVASGILHDAARSLAGQALAAARQAGFNDQPAPLALAGGVLENQQTFREEIVRELQAMGMALETIRNVYIPARGAVRLAME